MNPYSRTILAASLLLVGAVVPGLGQNTGTPKIMPKLEPIAETRLLMEGLAHSNFRGLERNLSKSPIDDESWIYARGQALLIAETGNLLMLRPPKNQGSQAQWFQNAMDLRTQGMALAHELSKKELPRAKAGMERLAASCNRCHTTFRVNVDIVPFAPAEPPPVRKVSIDID